MVSAVHGVCFHVGDKLPCGQHSPAGADRIAASRGHELILCPMHAFYFNFPQSTNEEAGPFYSGLSGFDHIDWKHVLTFDTSVPGDKVIGMQANLWSECIPDMKKLEYMLVPRICALAEKAWRYGFPVFPMSSPDVSKHSPPTLIL